MGSLIARSIDRHKRDRRDRAPCLLGLHSYFCFNICNLRNAQINPTRIRLFQRGMAKRQAEESLESLAHKDSPSAKKVRVEEAPEDYVRAQIQPPQFAQSHSNGAHPAADERNGNDILAAADQEEEELEEALGSAPTSPEVEEDQSAFSAPSRQIAPTEGYTDLYLDTINRSVLDFDFEKLCSISLTNINVYACLVCGKYFQGRGPKSHAYFHALEVGHHVYVNMQTKKVWVLPEGYEVKSKSLEDIKFVVDPTLSKDEVMKLDKEAKDAWDLGGKKYHPGENHVARR